MDRINGANTIDIGGGKRGWRQQNKAAGIAGTEMTSAWFNAVQEELMKVIEAAGIAGSAGDWTQLYQALGKMRRGRYAVDTGGASNTIVITPDPATITLTAGDHFFIRLANPITGASTVVVSSLAAVALRRADGTATQAGDAAANQLIETVFDGAALRIVSSQAAPVAPAASDIVHFGVDTGAANTLVATVAPGITAYADGQIFEITVAVTNTGTAVTGNFGGGVKSIVHADGSNPLVGELVGGTKALFAYDGGLGKLVLLGVPKAYVDAVNAAGLATRAATGVLIAIRRITTSGTYTPTPGTTSFYVTLEGAAGSGGGGESNTSGSAPAGGGGAGGRSEKLFQAAAGVTGTLTLASGGPSVPHATNGNDGGTSTFAYNGVTLTAYGGKGGLSAVSGGTGGLGGDATGGDINTRGDPGGGGSQPGFPGQSGNGGQSRYGTAGRGAYLNAGILPSDGTDGSGGGGGNGGNGSYDTSGRGGNAVFIVMEYR